MCMSIVLVVIPAGFRPQTRASTSSRETARPPAVVESDLVPLQVGQAPLEGNPPDGRRPPRRASQDGLDPGEQLLDAERLDHVIVGTQPQPPDAVVLGPARGQDDHRQRRPRRADLAEDGQAVAAGEDQVQQQQVAVRPEGRGESRGPFARFQGGISGEAQGIDQAAPDRRVVLDDQDLLAVHGPTRT
jgi:hypothetical protein